MDKFEISIRSLNNQTYNVEVGPTDKISVLKDIVAQKYGMLYLIGRTQVLCVQVYLKHNSVMCLEARP